VFWTRIFANTFSINIVTRTSLGLAINDATS
jgi:hypothetical protein